MSEQTAVRTRERWVDDVKVIACILVVLGHFFQSMTKVNILPENDLYKWFNTAIYYFHVPLFFICSGYIYQKYSKVTSFEGWNKNILMKALALGVPYMTFTTATGGLKKVFSGSVNNQIGGLGDTLLLHPTSPYWYLYALFFIFLVTPTFSAVKMVVVGLMACTAVILLAATYEERLEDYGISCKIHHVDFSDTHTVCSAVDIYSAEGWNYKCCGSCGVGIEYQLCGPDYCSLDYEENEMARVFVVSNRLYKKE